MNRSRPPGFSLPELLVGVAIVAALAALAVPTWRQVESRGKGVVCLENLRQISAAVQFYITDNSGFIPPIATDMRDAQGAVVATRFWIELNPYLKYRPLPPGELDPYVDGPGKTPNLGSQERAYVCPANPRKASRGSAYVNYTGVLNASGGSYIPYLTEVRRRITSFQSPLGQLPYLIDGYASDNYRSVSLVMVDLYTAIDAAKADVDIHRPHSGLLSPLHGAGIHILYLDGHSAWIDVRAFAAAKYSYQRP